MSKKTHRDPIVAEAIAAAGGIKPMADAIGITPQGVWAWFLRRRIPTDRVLAVERITGISRERLRPDLYGAPRPRPRSRASNVRAVV